MTASPSPDPASNTTLAAGSTVRLPRLDAILALVLMVGAALAGWSLAGRVPSAILDPRNPDIYFSSDTSRVHSNMVSRDSNHHRTNVHPLFSILMYPAFHVVAAVTGNDLSGGDPLSPGAIRVARVMNGIAAGLAMGLLFGTLRTAGVRRGDTVLFCALAALSAFALYWFSIPETYPWGSVSILLALFIATVGSHRPLHAGWYLLGSIASLAITTTNWMVGTAAAWTQFKLRKFVLLCATALAVTLALAVAQKLIFPSSHLFIRASGERAFVNPKGNGGPARCLASIFSHTMIVPEIQSAPHSRVAGQTVLVTQEAAPASASVSGKVALGCWVLLLGAGVYTLVTLRTTGALRFTLGCSLLGQIGLHAVYGAETFLYAAHYGPMLVIMVALATLTRLRVPVLALTAVMLVCLALNNLPQFEGTIKQLAHSQVRLDGLPPGRD